MAEKVHSKNSTSFNKYTQYFKEKEIGLFLDKYFDKQADKILKDLNTLYESGDLRGCNELIKKINDNRIFRIFSKEKKVLLLDMILKKVLPNHFDAPSDILSFLSKIRFSIPENYSMDWKFFYTLYYLLCQRHKSDISNYIAFFKTLHKFIPEDSITQEDYSKIKKTFSEDLLKKNKSYAISIFMYFFPKKYISQDEQLQYQLYQLFTNCKNNFVGSCCMLSKILKKDGKFYFSKDETKNDEYIKTFIKYYFTNLNLYIIDDSSIKNDNYSSPTFVNNDKSKKKNKFDHSVIDVLLSLLFNKNLEKYKENIDENLKIILNNKHLYIKENSNSDLAKNFIKFINEFVHRLKGLFSGKKYEEEIYKKISSPIEYQNNEYLFNRLLDIVKYFKVCFKKIFLYENNGTLPTLQKLFKLISYIEISDDYMKKLLNNIEFDEYLKILNFFKDNIETKSIKFINKLQAILPLLLSKYVYTNYNKVREFIKDIINLLSSSINSANIEFDVNILIMFGTYFYDIKNKINKNKVYESLIPLITDATNTIMNNIKGFLDLICLRNNSAFTVFISSMKRFLDKETQKKISEQYKNYIEDNEVKSEYLTYYFNVIDEDDHNQIFKYSFNNMLYVDSSNDTKISEYFLYPIKDEELKLNVPYCSLEIAEKQSQKYQNIFSLLNYSKVLTNEKDIKKFYQIFYTLINREEGTFKRLAVDLFNSVLNSLLNCKIKEGDDDNEKDLIEYPSKESIQMINNIYKKIILPYEKFVNDYIKESKKEDNSKKIEQIMYIYIMLVKAVSLTKLNLILMLNDEDSNTEEFNIIKNQIDEYKEYKKLVDNSFETIKKIYDYNKENNEKKIFNNQNTYLSFDEIISNKLTMNSKGMTDKRSNLREKKSFLFKYFHLSDIKYFWLKKKLNVMNYNYFTLMKNFVRKDEFYYTCLNIYTHNLNSVNHPPHVVGLCRSFLYSLDKDKIKELYQKLFVFYEQSLKDIKEESETEKNIMKNISGMFMDLTFTYISLYPYETIPLLINILKIIYLLKRNKYKEIGKFTGIFFFKMRSLIYLPACSEKKYNKIINKYSGRNDIILNECLKLNKIDDKIKENNNKYYAIIRRILEGLVKAIEYENSKSENNFILNLFNLGNKNFKDVFNDMELIIIYIKSKDYILEVLDKSDEIYKKIMGSFFDIFYTKSIPISMKYFWMKVFHSFLKEEYNSYKEYEWIKFKSEEEFNNKWNTFKFEIKGKKKNEILPVPVEALRITKFNFTDKINDNSKYNVDIKSLIEILKEIKEWVEEQSLISNDNKKRFSTQEFISKAFGIDINNDRKIDFKTIKTLYYMYQLKYIDFEKNDFITNYKLEINEETKKNSTVVFELLLSKYNYMLNKKLFNEETKKEFWNILQLYTNGVNKKEDEKIISFFNFIFINSSSENIKYIFKDSNFADNSIDFVSRLYNLYMQSFSKLINESNIFTKEQTNELINKIISNDGNLILYSGELKNIIKLYYEMNNYLKYDYYSFEDKYTNDTINYFNELLSKDSSKRTRYNLYEVYSYFFYCLNDSLTLFSSIMPKIALCINEFKTYDKVDLGDSILHNMEGKFRNYNKQIDFKLLCDEVFEILKKEENQNDTNKLLYLQTINIVFNSQKHFNLNKYTSQEIFDCLYKVFSLIKNEDLKIKYASIFVSYFNDLSDEENNKFIKEYQEKILNSDENNNYIYILMSQLLRFRMDLPDYIQNLILSLKKISMKKLKNIIVSFLKIAMDNYHGTYIYMKNNITPQCKDTLEEMTIEKSYFA